MEISRFELLNAWDEAFTMVIKKNLHQIIIESDSQLTVNAIHCNNSVPRDTVNLVIRNVGFLLNEVAIERQIEWLRVLIDSWCSCICLLCCCNNILSFWL